MLLIENGITPKLFLHESKTSQDRGIGLFIELLVPKEQITYVSPENWTFKEGGSIRESVSGLTTLACDIVKNEEELGLSFKNILIDSGSGLTAATLIATFGLMKKEATIHVMQTALSFDAFLDVLEETKTALEDLTGEKITTLPTLIQHVAPTARSFGATNSTIFNEIVNTARHEGFFLDPIYSTKLYLLLKELLSKGDLIGPTLFIHSGGLLSLAGFQDKLQNLK